MVKGGKGGLRLLSILGKRIKKKNHYLYSAILAILALAFLLGGCMRFVPYGQGGMSQMGSNNPLLSGLTASEDALVAGCQYEILFTVEASGVGDEVMLCDGNQQIASMNDSGQNGDLTAGDGIYSVTLLINTGEQEERLQLYAKTDAVTSEAVEIHVFDMPTRKRHNKRNKSLLLCKSCSLPIAKTAISLKGK